MRRLSVACLVGVMIALFASVGLSPIFANHCPFGNVPNFYAVGDATTDNFGFAVSGAGDVNKDGYEDFIVGAPKAIRCPTPTSCHKGPGYARVFAGNSFATLYTVRGEVTDDFFGAAVAGLGDVDGDGYADFVVGAPGISKIFVYSGKTSSLLYSIQGQSGTFFGWAISSRTSPGPTPTTRFLVGAPATNVNKGAAFLYAAKGGTLLARIDGQATGGQLGWSVSIGRNFLVVGSDAESGSGPAAVSRGAARVYSTNGSLIKVLTGSTQNQFFGWAVSSAGDVDYDGYEDVIVGSYSSTTPAKVYSGKTWTFLKDLPVVPSRAGSVFGLSVADGGYALGYDQYSDPLVGGDGFVTTYNGAGTLPATESYFSPTGYSDGYGWSIARMGKVWSGYDGLLIGAPLYPNGTRYQAGYAGVVYCGFGYSEPLVISALDAGTGDKIVVKWTYEFESSTQESQVSIGTAPGTFFVSSPLVGGDGHTEHVWVFDGLSPNQPYYIAARHYNANSGVFGSYVGLSSPVYASRPVFLVHGWRGVPSNWDNYIGWLQAQHFNYVWAVDNMNKCGVPGESDFGGNANRLAEFIEMKLGDLEATTGIQISAIDLVGHSMGGLVSRRYISGFDRWRHRRVNHLIMLGTPNGGVGYANTACASPDKATKLCAPATCELGTWNMTRFNSMYPVLSQTRYYTVAGTAGRVDGACGQWNWTTCIPPSTPLADCPNDGTVPVSSVEELAGFTSADRTDYYCHTDPPLAYYLDQPLFNAFVLPSLKEQISASAVLGAQATTATGETWTSQLASASCSEMQLGAVRTDTLTSEGGVLTVSVESTDVGLAVTLESPSGAVLDPVSISAYGHYVADDSGSAYTVLNAEPGIWRVHYDASRLSSSSAGVCLLQGMNNSVELTAAIGNRYPQQGSPVPLTATLMDGSAPIINASVQAKVTFTGGAGTTTLQLFDDGIHNDGSSGDGLYGIAFVNTEGPGLVTFDLSATGSASSVGAFSRKAQLSAYFSGCTDLDNDGYGWPGDASCPVGPEPDCDDSDPSSHPGATEVCDGEDNNCNRVIDEGFPDSDGDLCGDACDCARQDAGVFAIPLEVTGLKFLDDGSTLIWDAATLNAGTSTVHDVLRGSLVQLPPGSGAAETYLAYGISSNSTIDPLTPIVGEGFWYLVRGRNACGSGTYGRMSGDVGPGGGRECRGRRCTK